MSKIKCGHIENSNELVYIGYRLHIDGRIEQRYFQKRDLTRCGDPQPVTWRGKPAELHYSHWTGKVPFNRTAANLITHPGFVIRGDAIVTVGAERWQHFRVRGSVAKARSLVSHVTFRDAARVIFMPAGRHKTHTNIFVKSSKDAVAVQFAIA